MDLTMFCQGCLSQDRSLKPLGALEMMFNIIFNQSLKFTFQMVSNTSDLLLCWECIKTLKNIERFHHKVILAQHTLHEIVQQKTYGNYIESLSSLVSTPRDAITIELETLQSQVLEQKLKCLKEVSISNVRSLSKNTDNNQCIKEEAFDETLPENLKQESDIDNKLEPEDLPEEVDNSFEDKFEPEYLTDEVVEEDNIDLEPPKKKTRLTTRKPKVKKTSVKSKVMNKNVKAKPEDLAEEIDDSFEDIHEPEYLTDEVVEEDNNIDLEPPKKKTRVTTRKPRVKKTSVKSKVINKNVKAKTLSSRSKILPKDTFFELNKGLFTVIQGSQYDIKMKRAKRLDKSNKKDGQYSLDISSSQDKDKLLTCSNCKEVCYNERDFTSHMKLHFQKYMCRLCADDIIYDEDRIISHMNSEHAYNNTIKSCKKCAKRFVCVEELASHRAECCVYKCNDCPKVYSSKEKIALHCRNYHLKVTCKECNITLKSYHYYEQHNQRCHAAETAYCATCDVKFKSQMSLKEHLKTSVKHLPESEVKRFYCSKCPNSYRKKFNLNSHYDMVHVGITKYHCDTCQRYFPNSSVLKKHNRKTHLKIRSEKRHLCTMCGKSYSTSTALRDHILQHTIEKPYCCVHCGLRFGRTGWNYHMIVVHPDRVRDAKAARELAAATPYVEEPREPYKNICNICGKDFKLKRYLIYHQNVHTGAKPYACSICGVEFRFSGNYYAHLRRKHKIFGDKNKKNKKSAKATVVGSVGSV